MSEDPKSADGNAGKSDTGENGAPKSERERRVLGAGSILFQQGDPGDEAFLIQEGRVELSMKGTNGRRVVIGELGRGEIVGELALIGDGSRLAKATALSDTVLVVVTRREFDCRLEAMDPVMRRVLQTLTDKLKAMSERHVDEAAKIR